MRVIIFCNIVDYIIGSLVDVCVFINQIKVVFNKDYMFYNKVILMIDFVLVFKDLKVIIVLDK